MKTTVEDLSTKASKANGWVVLFKYAPKITGVMAVPAPESKAQALRRLRRVIATHPTLSVMLRGFKIEPRSEGRTKPAQVYDISFGVDAEKADDYVPLFIEFLKQTQVITDPIVSDLRNVDLKLR